MWSLLIFVDNDTRESYRFIVADVHIPDPDREIVVDLESAGDMTADKELAQLYTNVGFELGVDACKENADPRWVWNLWGARTLAQGECISHTITQVHIIHVNL
jgi:hypothetical protein